MKYLMRFLILIMFLLIIPLFSISKSIDNTNARNLGIDENSKIWNACLDNNFLNCDIAKYVLHFHLKELIITYYFGVDKKDWYEPCPNECKLYVGYMTKWRVSSYKSEELLFQKQQDYFQSQELLKSIEEQNKNYVL